MDYRERGSMPRGSMPTTRRDYLMDGYLRMFRYKGKGREAKKEKRVPRNLNPTAKGKKKVAEIDEEKDEFGREEEEVEGAAMEDGDIRDDGDGGDDSDEYDDDTWLHE